MTQAKAHVESITSFEQHVVNLKSSPLDVMAGADAMHGKAPASSAASSVAQDYANHAKQMAEVVAELKAQGDSAATKTLITNSYNEMLNKHNQMFSASKNLTMEQHFSSFNRVTPSMIVVLSPQARASISLPVGVAALSSV